jgi:hypothetical protein
MGNLCSGRSKKIKAAKERLQCNIDRFSWQISIDMETVVALEKSAKDLAKRGDRDQAVVLLQRRHRKIKSRKEMIRVRENLMELRDKIDTGEIEMSYIFF